MRHGRLLRLLRCGHIAAEELVQQRECSGLAVHFILIVAGILIQLTEHTAHLIGQSIQLIIRKAHLLHSLIDLGNAQTPGAFDTVALIHGHAVLDFRDKDNGNILFALGAHFRLHRVSLLSAQYSTEHWEIGKQIVKQSGWNTQTAPHRHRTTGGSCTNRREAPWGQPRYGCRNPEWLRSPPA